MYTREIPAFGGTSLALGVNGAHLAPPSAAVKENKKIGAHSFKNFRRVMRIPNMCLILKLDNGKVVSIANEQTDRQNHRTIQYRISIYYIDTYTVSVQFPRSHFPSG